MEKMPIVIVGHVDHGKSSIIGRLLADTNAVSKDKIDVIKADCKKHSKKFEYAYLIDALKEERTQGITIDAARIFFKSNKRDYVIIDAPGHKEFLKNMVTGAARAEAGVLVIDAKEGVKENTKRHAYMLSSLGIEQVSILINKMDLIDYDKNIYDNICDDIKSFLKNFNMKIKSIIPVSAIKGDNIIDKSEKMNWYEGKDFLKAIDEFEFKITKSNDFRMFVQGVYKFSHERIVVGTINSGEIKVGDEIIIYPSKEKSIIKEIRIFNDKVSKASKKMAVGLILENQVYIKRGDILTNNHSSKLNISDEVVVNLFWLGKNPFIRTKNYYLKIGTIKIGVKLREVIKVINSSTLKEEKKDQIDNYDTARCILKLDENIAFDISKKNIDTSRFVIVDDNNICGGGMIESKVKAQNIFWQKRKISREDREKLLNQKGMVIWLTGMSGAGKSTISMELEKRLMAKGKIAYVLDGDNMRHGLNQDLGFSREDREENIRRVAQVAKLFKDAGIITIVSTISPYKNIRLDARRIIGYEDYILAYIKCSLKTCEKRDPKGLYKKAKKGEISNFTGVDALYEEPKNPHIIIDTDKLNKKESIDLMYNYILKLLKED